eukprot:CAMPEP_0170507730 /NCGR_PEP_ID=MMETSP0208-20121228/59885_1 /TAXON_ID=197538 /ORGANISM="Strombidium inclinatum, Strain S3" /LENGTH=62 /DNA_ID=CAMNT_0010790121 /DNA_START=19 /DNA_END=204 /DNA_ORIENTATION=+
MESQARMEQPPLETDYSDEFMAQSLDSAVCKSLVRLTHDPPAKDIEPIEEERVVTSKTPKQK